MALKHSRLSHWIPSDFEHRILLVAFLIFCIIAAIVFPVVEYQVRNNALDDLEKRLDELAYAKAESLSVFFQRSRRETLFLANTPPVQGIVRAEYNNGLDPLDNSDISVWKKRLQAIFTAYLRTHPEVAQVRYIGVANEGLELVRADQRDGEIVVTPAEKLQKKGNRDYFADTLRYAPGEVYLSDINLNREFGVVEEPHQPTFRASTPVYDSGGNVFGMVIINFSMREVLNGLSNLHSTEFRSYLVNQDGDFLVHPDASKTFGFDLGQRFQWQQEFQSLSDATEDVRGLQAIGSYQGPGGIVHAVKHRVSQYNKHSTGDLTMAVLAPDSLIVAQVNSARRFVLVMLVMVSGVLGLLLYLVLLNARRREEAGLKNAQLAAIVDSSNEAIIGETLQGVVTSWNKAAEKMYGYSAEEAIGKSTSDLIVPSDRQDEAVSILATVANGEVVPHFDTHRRRKDGTLLNVALTLSPVCSDDGRIVGVAKVARDITEEKAIRSRVMELNQNLERMVSERTQQLEQSMALQRAMINYAGYAQIATDTDGLIKLFNPAAEKLLGYSAEEMVDRQTPAIFHDPGEVVERAELLSKELGLDIQPGFEVFVAKARWGVPDEREWTYIRKDGVRIPVQLKVSSLVNNRGVVTGFLGIAIDLTETKKRQKELEKAKLEADAANLAKGEFLANMSHEIRTPMNAVLGMLELLKKSRLNHHQHNYVEKARTAAETLLSIINDVLDFSKIEAGKLQLDQHVTTMEPLLRDLAFIVGMGVGKKDIEVLFDIDPELPPRLIIDSVRFKQILINLAGNAVKFTDQGKVVIEIRCEPVSVGQLLMKCRIIDTGIGMSPEAQRNIFESFSQGDAGITRRFGGSGLGLAISRRLIRLMGGELELESELGKGSIFSFSLVVDAVVETALSAASFKEVPAELNALRVLVVDDHDKAREVIARIASLFNWQADQAASGEEALQLIESARESDKPYQLVLIDERMPDMDGWQTAKAIRGLSFSRELTLLLMLTGFAPDEVEGEIREHQNLLDGFVGKPVTPSDLLDAVVEARSSRIETGDLPALTGDRPLAKMRLLLVEDNPANQMVARELLTDAGAEVVIADNGRIAVEAVEKASGRFDAVLMDLQMPVMDGLTATRKIRKNLGLKELPIVAMTANAQATDRQACLEAGMNEHIGKPFHIDQLVDLLLSVTESEPRSARESTVSDLGKNQSPEGFNMELALKRMGNKQQIYAEQVKLFVADHAEDMIRARRALEENNSTEALRVLHSLRGLAGTLGAETLAKQLRGLEQAIKDDLESTELEPMLATSEALLSKACQVLAGFGGREDSSQQNRVPGDAPAHADQIEELLSSLETLLEKRNMRAQAVYDELSGLLSVVPGSPLEKMGSAIRRLDFNTARTLLNEVRTSFGP